MKTIIYVGEFAQIEIRPPYGQLVLARGVPTPVADELADRLLAEYPGIYAEVTADDDDEES